MSEPHSAGASHSDSSTPDDPTAEARQLLLRRIEAAFDATVDLRALYKAIAGPPDLKEFGAIATTARSRLREDPNAALEPEEEQALELALRMTRPAPLVEDGQVPPLAALVGGKAFPAWSTFRTGVRPLLRAIGRLDRAADKSPCGTGFLIAPHLVMTNEHVLDELSRGTKRLKAGQAVIRFKLEQGVPDGFEAHPIRDVHRVHPSADLALLVIDPIPGAPVLEFSTSRIQPGAPVVAVGFPASDLQRNPYFVPALFPGSFGLKRSAPGVLLTSGPWTITHDCSTLSGSSGSPIFCMNSCHVVGVHRAGKFMWRNHTVPAPIAAAFAKRQ